MQFKANREFQNLFYDNTFVLCRMIPKVIKCIGKGIRVTLNEQRRYI